MKIALNHELLSFFSSDFRKFRVPTRGASRPLSGFDLGTGMIDTGIPDQWTMGKKPSVSGVRSKKNTSNQSNDIKKRWYALWSPMIRQIMTNHCWILQLLGDLWLWMRQVGDLLELDSWFQMVNTVKTFLARSQPYYINSKRPYREVYGFKSYRYIRLQKVKMSNTFWK